MSTRTKAKTKKPVYLDRSRQIDERVQDLLRRMTIEEKIYQIGEIEKVEAVSALVDDICGLAD